MTALRTFEPRDLVEMDMTPEHRAVAEKCAATIERLSAQGLAHTLVTNSGKPVIVFAGAPTANYGADECEVFIFPARGRAQHRIAFWKGLRDMLAYARNRFKRVHAVSKNEPALCRFFERLGFVPEPTPSNVSEYVGLRGWVLFAVAVAVTVALDRFLAPLCTIPGAALADPVTAAIVIGSVATATTAGLGIANYEQGQAAAKAQKDLEHQQAAQLQAEQSRAAELAAEAATSGSSFGFSGNSEKLVLTGFGFGSGTTHGDPNAGRGQITGLG